MISKETISTLLQQAVQAPSGDNSQPWRFVWSETDQTLFVHNLPENDNPIFNYKQRGSFIAHGALLENIKLLAGTFQLEAHTHTFPNAANENLVAHITFTPSATVNPLARSIQARHTNRKPYQSRPLTRAEQEALANAAGEDITLTLEQNESNITKLAHAVSVAEQIMLQFKPLHDYFFHMIRWTSQEEIKQRSGLYVKTMELAPPQVVIFKLYSFWPIAKMLNALGLSKFIGSENAKIYKQASAFILFRSTAHTPDSYLALGSTLQRVWLTATELGLSVQPVAGVLYLSQRLADGQVQELSTSQQEFIRSAAKVITSVFAAEPEQLRMLIRVGQANPPAAYAQKKAPTIQFV